MARWTSNFLSGKALTSCGLEDPFPNETLIASLRPDKMSEGADAGSLGQDIEATAQIVP